MDNPAPSWPDRRILDLLGVSIPIIQAPMAGASTPQMALAVSAAGGLGSLPCAQYDLEQAREALAIVRAGTDAPVNLNSFCHAPPRPDPAAQMVWRARLAPYYVELGLDPAQTPPPGGRSSISNVAGMLQSLRENAAEGAEVRAGLVCEWTPEAGMPSVMLVQPRAADAARFFGACVRDRHGEPPLLLLMPLTPAMAALAAADSQACHDLLRDTVAADFAAYLPSVATGGRAGGRRRAGRGGREGRRAGRGGREGGRRTQCARMAASLSVQGLPPGVHSVCACPARWRGKRGRSL
jgi:hypothetical protein